MSNETGESFIDSCIRSIRQRAFYNSYWKTFDIARADTEEQKEQAFRLRYSVYCIDNMYIEPSNHPGGLEKDVFDSHAIHHLLLHKPTNKAVGVLRILLPDESQPLESFELQKNCDHPLLQIGDKVRGFAEISRFCMDSSFRRRPRDGHLLPAYYEQEWNDAENAKSSLPFLRRHIPYAPLGLLTGAFETIMGAGITNCVAALESKQFHTLRRMGLNYRVLGPRIDTHGILQPLAFNIKAVLDNMEKVNPECWEIVSDRGRLHSRASELYRNGWHDSVFDEETHDMIMRKIL